jgi:hypothetical protein
VCVCVCVCLLASLLATCLCLYSCLPVRCTKECVCVCVGGGGGGGGALSLHNVTSQPSFIKAHSPPFMCGRVCVVVFVVVFVWSRLCGRLCVVAFVWSRSVCFCLTEWYTICLPSRLLPFSTVLHMFCLVADPEPCRHYCHRQQTNIHYYCLIWCRGQSSQITVGSDYSWNVSLFSNKIKIKQMIQWELMRSIQSLWTSGEASSPWDSP